MKSSLLNSLKHVIDNKACRQASNSHLLLVARSSVNGSLILSNFL